jgi:hypothetical protein
MSVSDELINFLDETKTVLAEHGRSVNDVMWCGTQDGLSVCSWSEFADMSADIWYDNGFGGEEINDEFVIVGNDWWLERHSYDGSEWWEYKSLPRPTQCPLPFRKTLIAETHSDLEAEMERARLMEYADKLCEEDVCHE